MARSDGARSPGPGHQPPPPMRRPARPAARSADGSPCRLHRRLHRRPEDADHSTGPSEHHDDEDERDHHLPVEERIAKPRREEADRDRSEDRAREARPPADRGPDHELRRQQEPDRLGGDDALVRRVEGAGEARHSRAHREREGLQAARPEAEELEPLLVLGHRAQQLPERRPQEVSDHRRGEGERGEDHEVEVLEGVDAGRLGDPGHPVEAARHVHQRVRELEAEHREGEGDEGEVGPGTDLPVEDERPDRAREEGGHQARSGEDGDEQPRLAPDGPEPRAGEIRPDPEEEGLAEGKEPGPAPAKGDPLADHAVEEVEPELVGGEAPPDERHEGEPEEDGEGGDRAARPAAERTAGRAAALAPGPAPGLVPGLTPEARAASGTAASAATRAHGAGARGTRWRPRAR